MIEGREEQEQEEQEEDDYEILWEKLQLWHAEVDPSIRMRRQPEMTDRRRLTECDGRLMMTMTPIEICTGPAKQQID